MFLLLYDIQLFYMIKELWFIFSKFYILYKERDGF